MRAMHIFNRLKEKSIFGNNEIPGEARFKQYVDLIIIDEAERLQPRAIEQIRDIYDKKSLTIILIRMPGIEKVNKILAALFKD